MLFEVKKVPKLIIEDKENNASFSNKVKTPTSKMARKEKKSPLAFKAPKELSGLKGRRHEEECLTPKGRTTSTRSNISNLKQKLEVMAKREGDLSTVRKKGSRFPAKNDVNQL